MLADLVLLLHVLFVLFVGGGLPAIWIGAVRRRPWCRAPWFRGLHLGAIGFVVAETLLGYACPLTLWEDALRGTHNETGFIARGPHAVPCAAPAIDENLSMPREPNERHDRLDAVRGFAICWMVGFHFSFDLNHLGWVRPWQDFYRDPFWTVQRTCIVSLFLLCAGAGQALAIESGQSWLRFRRRWMQVAGCALLVSAGSALMFPRSWISFGVLHGMAVMLPLARALALAWPRRQGLLLSLGVAAIALPMVVQHPFFDTRATNWLGLVTRKPVTEDFVPVLPWMGVMLWGLAAGDWLARRGAVIVGAVPLLLRPLAAIGRWPLTVYMLHQPILIGALLALGHCCR